MRIVPRSEWGARPAKRTTMFRKPAAELYVHHLAAEWHGAAGMRSAQKFHQDTRGWRDVAYTFCVDDDGTIYEGTGPHVVGTHTRDRNSRAMAICAMGDFDKRSPTPQMLASISWLIRHGQTQGWWGGLTGGHRDAPGASTACPGRYLYARIPQLKAATSAVGEEDELTPEEKQMLRDVHDVAQWLKDTLDKNADGRMGHTIESVNKHVDMVVAHHAEQIVDAIGQGK